VAALLSLFGGAGLGQLYNGRGRRAAVFWLGSPILYCLGAGLTVRLPVRFLSLAPLLLPLGWGLAALIDAWRDAGRPGRGVPRPWFSHGAVCAGLALLNVFVWGPAWVGATRMTWVRAYRIPTGGMEPTVLIGDHLLADMSMYGLRNPFSGSILSRRREPARGEIIVFLDPKDRRREFLKRVIALPGETVEVRNKRVLVDGMPLSEPYVRFIEEDSGDEGDPSSPRDNWGPQLVPPGHLFVLGDNRDNSRDSRYWGFVPSDDVRGMARVVYYSTPPSRESFRSQNGSDWVRKTLSAVLLVRWRRLGMVLS
jgi:signal peptidase I